MESDGHFMVGWGVDTFFSKCGFQSSAYKLKFIEAEGRVGSLRCKKHIFLKIQCMK